MTAAQDLIAGICKDEYDTDGVWADIDNWNPAEMREFMDEIKKLVHHKDTTVGLWATDVHNEILDAKGLMFQIEY